MGRKTVLVDDLDGKELPEGTKPVRLSVNGWAYDLYLSDDNTAKLMEAITPFTENAELVDDTPVPRRTSRAASADKEKMKAVREWAQATKYTYKNAKGEDTTLGDRGRIPQEVVDAYDKAN
jgi:hypothetical protein